jgi:hypothetical protein
LLVDNVLAAEPQALTPPYLSEFPSPERVMSAMQVADPRETALRQMGAFYQLIEIIKTLSGSREFRGFTVLKIAAPIVNRGTVSAADRAVPSPCAFDTAEFRPVVKALVSALSLTNKSATSITFPKRGY